jgi:hypothetical protein
MKIAPIVLFVFNRPQHTEITLRALASNDLAKDSVLYIYSDGPKENADEDAIKKINETRVIIRKEKWCKEVHIIESDVNKGLANSVIHGVTEQVNKYGRVIVIEDDIVIAKGFLKFMNEALEMYKEDIDVAGISGWSFPIRLKDETYFSRVGACWGWGTWKRVWEKTSFDTELLIKVLEKTNRLHEYNIDGTYDYMALLHRQSKGQSDSWAIRFYTNYFLNNMLFLFPNKSLVQNIGFDNSGTHYNNGTKTNSFTIIFEKEFINVKRKKVGEEKIVRDKIIMSFQPKANKVNSFVNLISRIKKKLL